MTTEVAVDGFGTETTTYTYNASNQLIKASTIYDGQTSNVSFTYTGDKLTEVLGDDNEMYTITYDANNLPTRVDEVYDGDVSYELLTYSDGKFVSSEGFIVEDGVTEKSTKTTVTYNGDKISSVNMAGTDDDGATYEDFLVFTDMETDDKNSPYNSLAFAFLDDIRIYFTPQNNITKITSSVFGLPATTTTYTYTYNDNNYPTQETSTEDGETTTNTYTYNCP
jgi:hypothetical protein